ncbi:hypothetical protein L3X38_044717 [Prunus dulcis]|uniref:Uncharacterized protein n=1 Tax=Prunus dulcis TaxID=3755 RepID=A0AAD4V0Z3_PRUDU|nr:hypothetical protein L3X38_044717 [Prunus dulcis]
MASSSNQPHVVNNPKQQGWDPNDPKVHVTPNFCKHVPSDLRPCQLCKDLFSVNSDNVQVYRSPTPSPPKPPSPLVCKCTPQKTEWCSDCYGDKLITHWEEVEKLESTDDSDDENYKFRD